MADTLQKPMTANTQDTAIRHAYNDVDKTISTNGFLVGKIGARVDAATAGDTTVFTFSDNGVFLYEITVVYTDASQTTLLSAERTA